MVKTVPVRISPKVKVMLDQLKDGVKIPGKRYYDRKMKYDDLIYRLLVQDYEIAVVQFVNDIWQHHRGSISHNPGIDINSRYDFVADVPTILLSFFRFLKQIKPLYEPDPNPDFVFNDDHVLLDRVLKFIDGLDL